MKCVFFRYLLNKKTDKIELELRVFELEGQIKMKDVFHDVYDV